ncbi:integrase arm-type DNA-binding domain-containing protein [Paraburkholderia agricolaris]|uniref:integrase arm-type DNA-binding domain-containing protein n=1 Tax=Paraburkholderia agricolaris TaxID=2152888 RepID=UPI0038BC8134
MSPGQENFHSLGPYPDITLTDARRSAATARNLVCEGFDPVAYRQAESIARKRAAKGAFHLVAQRDRSWIKQANLPGMPTQSSIRRWSLVGTALPPNIGDGGLY